MKHITVLILSSSSLGVFIPGYKVSNEGNDDQDSQDNTADDDANIGPAHLRLRSTGHQTHLQTRHLSILKAWRNYRLSNHKIFESKPCSIASPHNYKQGPHPAPDMARHTPA